ncbi:hypothetical protein [Breoghania sp.]|uniref:homocitrate synthase/isopropylmalate synthase family protein n=1 Tax=Breoghania sp. TaxID=2065378 RepID=UPI0026096ACE|nr:hypothetical protein [Breoghania sp.]MDJ0933244.1 hypothetical protein [Breoghania sp.]
MPPPTAWPPCGRARHIFGHRQRHRRARRQHAARRNGRGAGPSAQVPDRDRLEAAPLLAAGVADASGRPVPHAKAIVGSHVFSHESGIHVAALLKAPETYQGLDPAEIGRRHTIVLGKHSGTAALGNALARLGHKCDPAVAPVLLSLMRHHATKHKGPVGDGDLERLFLLAEEFLDLGPEDGIPTGGHDDTGSIAGVAPEGRLHS